MILKLHVLLIQEESGHLEILMTLCCTSILLYKLVVLVLHLSLSTSVKPLVDNYNLFEAAVAKQTLQNKEFSHISDVYLYLSSFTAYCESSFSALKRIKTYLTSIMGEQRLSDLAEHILELWHIHGQWHSISCE